MLEPCGSRTKNRSWNYRILKRSNLEMIESWNGRIMKGLKIVGPRKIESWNNRMLQISNLKTVEFRNGLIWKLSNGLIWTVKIYLQWLSKILKTLTTQLIKISSISTISPLLFFCLSFTPLNPDLLFYSYLQAIAEYFTSICEKCLTLSPYGLIFFSFFAPFQIDKQLVSVVTLQTINKKTSLWNPAKLIHDRTR